MTEPETDIDLADSGPNFEGMRDMMLLDAAIQLWAARTGRDPALASSPFAREVLVRDPRQVRRWRAGRPLPQQVRETLRAMLPAETLAEIDATPEDELPPRKMPANPGELLDGLAVEIPDRDALARELMRLGWTPPSEEE